MTPSLAVVIPLFNGGRWIEEALRSVLAQTAKPGEIVVVDDGSEDDGAALACRFEGVRVIPSERKKRARRTGLLATSAELVAFLDQDDLWHPAHLARLAALLERYPDAPAAASGWRLFLDGETPKLTDESIREAAVDPWSRWPVECPVPTPSAVLFCRDALVEVGGWAFDVAPDWEAYLRLTDPRTMIGLGAKTCGYRLHASALSTSLRSEGFPYLDLQRRGADASLDERLGRGDVDDALKARLERRRRVLEHLASIMHGVREDDAARAEHASRALEQDVGVEPTSYVDACFEMLAYLFCPGHEHEAFVAGRDALLGDLERVWSEDAPRTRGILARHRRRHRFRWRRLVRALVKGRLGDVGRQWRARRD
jgi:glycosyltransferase involved in cell wall biosynthesis